MNKCVKYDFGLVDTNSNKCEHSGCPKKHNSWGIFKNVFFYNLWSCLIPKRIIINIIWQFYYSKIDPSLGYIAVTDFSTELNCKKSLTLIQYLEDDILNYSSTVMFRGTPCKWIEELKW